MNNNSVMKKVFYTAKREEWRTWLVENYKSADEVYFVFPTKDSGEPSLLYNDAVEEALCFGWIDGVAGKLDDKHGTRRFTKRRPGSSYSRANIERLIWLEKEGLIHESVRPSVIDLINTPYAFPKDIINEIKKDKSAWKYYQGFSDPYKRIRIAYIDDARKRPDEFKKRLENFIAKTREGKLIIGFGGIDKYYK